MSGLLMLDFVYLHIAASSYAGQKETVRLSVYLMME